MRYSVFGAVVSAVPLAALLSSPPVAAETLHVIGVSPAAQALAVPRSKRLVVRFDQVLDPLSVNNGSLVVTGRSSGVVPGTVEALNDKLHFTPAQPLAPGDWVTARVAASVRGIGGQVLAHGHAWNFWTASSPASLNLVLQDTLFPGDTPYGGYAGDFDHDRDLDLAVANEGTDDMAVYINDGVGGYAPPVKYNAGAVPSPIQAADLDGDTHMDLIVGNTLSSDVSVFLGHGDGSFDRQSRYGTGANPRGIAPIDYDRDGALDLLVANRNSGDVSFLRNLGDGHFGKERRRDLPGAGEDAAAASDVNGDGLEDFIIGYYGSDEVRVYLAQEEGGFALASVAASGGHVWQMAVGDVNGDGLLDAVTSNSSTSTAGVLLALAPGVLSAAVTYPVGSFPLAVTLADPDGDGDLDMLTSNFSGGSFTLYLNDGSGVFGGRRDLPAAIAGSCAVFFDRDGDGDLDLAAIDELADHVRLYRNE
jgi:Big-like domain-containing protein/VCBS repeat protein